MGAGGDQPGQRKLSFIYLMKGGGLPLLIGSAYQHRRSCRTGSVNVSPQRKLCRSGSFPANALTSMSSVERGRWKLVIIASTARNR